MIIAGEPAARWRAAARAAVLVLVAAGMVWVWLHRDKLGPASIEAALAGNPAAPALFIALQIAASLLFVPRTVLAVAAGLLFGVGWGLVWAALGSVLGAIIGFCVARYVNSGLVQPERLRRFGPMLLRAEHGGWRAVAALRLVPIIPHSLANYALGLTRIPLAAYAWGSFLGQLPLTFAYVDLGAAGKEAMAGSTRWIVPTVVGLGALAVTLLVPRLMRRRA